MGVPGHFGSSAGPGAVAVRVNIHSKTSAGKILII
jgi:hypothetical protein